MALIQGTKDANKTVSRFGWCANGGFLEGFWRVKVDRGKGRLEPSALKSCADRPHVEKHPLWSRFRCTLDGHKTISRIPTHPIPIGVGDDRATANFIGDAQADAQRF